MSRRTQDENLTGLAAYDIRKSFKGREVVGGVSISVNEGEIVGLLGPNGAGKTTSFYMLVGLLAPSQGRVCLNSADISNLPLHARAKLGIGYLPQNVSIFRKLTVRQNIQAIMEVAKIEKSERVRTLDQLLNKFQIEHIADSYGVALSGGERRRVEIARALVLKPKYLLLDEPFAGIDPVTVSEIQKIIIGLKKDGLGVLITDHNVRETLGSCDRAYILASGKVISQGNPQEILNSPVVKQVYLGEDFKI